MPDTCKPGVVLLDTDRSKTLKDFYYSPYAAEHFRVINRLRLGNEAVCLCQTENPAFLLMNLSCPESDGCVVAQEASASTNVVVIDNGDFSARLPKLKACCAAALYGEYTPEFVAGMLQRLLASTERVYVEYMPAPSFSNCGDFTFLRRDEKHSLFANSLQRSGVRLKADS